MAKIINFATKTIFFCEFEPTGMDIGLIAVVGGHVNAVQKNDWFFVHASHTKQKRFLIFYHRTSTLSASPTSSGVCSHPNRPAWDLTSRDT